MDLQRRLTLYLLGLVIGGGLAYWFYGERLTTSAWLPEAKLKQRLRSTLVKATPAAQQAMEQQGLSIADIRVRMDSARIDLGASTRSADSIVYSVSAPFNGRQLRLRIATLRDFDRDSTATLVELR